MKNSIKTSKSHEAFYRWYLIEFKTISLIAYITSYFLKPYSLLGLNVDLKIANNLSFLVYPMALGGFEDKIFN